MLPILPLIVLVPYLFLAPTLLLRKEASWNIAILASLLMAGLVGAAVYYASAQGLGSVSFDIAYIPAFSINLNMQLTNMNLILVVMTAIVFLATSIVGKYFIGKAERIYNVIFLLAEGSALGVFLSANLFLFYIFFEICEVALFFIIFIYGGYDRRYAAVKFIIYSIVATLLLLIGIILLYAYTTPHSFDIASIAQNAGDIPANIQLLVFVLLLVAFMIKMPAFPFHSWLPDAHTEAPATGSMILAGVLLKFGGYGLLLLFFMLPISAHYAAYLSMIFGFSAIYGAVVALKQLHLKRMIAYTSVADMGIVAFGLSSFSVYGTAGSLYLMLSHGLAISMLFMLAGSIDEGFGTLIISRINGLARSVPSVTYLFLMGIFVTVGLPLTAGFIGDLLIFIGAYGTFGTAGLVPLGAVFIVAAYLFWVVEKAFFGSAKRPEPLNSISPSVTYAGLLLAASAIILGVVPALLLGVSGF